MKEGKEKELLEPEGDPPDKPTFVKPDPADMTWKGGAVYVMLRRTAEMWQFFAFVFAAVLTLVFALIDDGMDQGRYRAIVKVAAFVIFGYALLVNRSVRRALVWLLEWWKTERY